MSALDRTAALRIQAQGWLTIREASALVGVSVATLRRWCDAGDVRCYTTPGGHRRFERAALLGLLAAPRTPRARVGCNGETAIRIVRAYRRDIRRSEHPHIGDAVPEEARRQFRDHGREIVAALVDLLDEPVSATSPTRERAQRSAAACGCAAAASGMTLDQAIELFLHFRTPFLHEIGAIARRWGLDATASTALLEKAADSVDGLLPAMLAGFARG